MKRLILVRHAKSSWKDSALADLDRPLTGRGKRDAPRMGKHLAGLGILPDVILASPAKRARKTAQLLAAAIPGAGERLRFDPSLYEASATGLLERVHTLDEAWQQVMLVGHNPGLTDFANLLTAAGLDNLPTCGVLVAEFPVASWKEVAAGRGRVAHQVVPRELPA